MEQFLPTQLLDLLTISVTLGFILMVLIQKFKKLPFFCKRWKIWLINLIFSFALGIPFSINFYHTSLIDGIWVSVFCFIGAPTIYEVLRNQNIINYKPSSISDYTYVPTANQIVVPNKLQNTNDASREEKKET